MSRVIGDVEAVHLVKSKFLDHPLIAALHAPTTTIQSWSDGKAKHSRLHVGVLLPVSKGGLASALQSGAPTDPSWPTLMESIGLEHVVCPMTA